MDRVGWTVRSRDIYKHYLTVHKCCFDRKGFGVTKHHISACNLRQCPKPSPICLGRPITLSDPSYRGEGLKLERSPRDEDPRDEGEGESLRITRLGRGTRIYTISGPPCPHLLLSTSLPISSAFTVLVSATFKVFWIVHCPQRQYRSILPFSLSTMEPDVRGLRAVALIGGVVKNKETGTISA
jgi:hypothetical protein